MLKHFSLSLFFLFMALLTSGCDQEPKMRTYYEVHMMPPAKAEKKSDLPDWHPTVENNPEKTQAVSAYPKTWSWQAPGHWAELPAQGMRQGYYKIPGEHHEAELTVISLGGSVGGLEANLKRWADQLSLELSETSLLEFANTFSTKKSSDGYEIRVWDYADLQAKESEQTADPDSMLVGILTEGETNVFIKMTGKKSLLQKEKGNFLLFLESFKKGSDA